MQDLVALQQPHLLLYICHSGSSSFKHKKNTDIKYLPPPRSSVPVSPKHSQAIKSHYGHASLTVPADCRHSAFVSARVVIKPLITADKVNRTERLRADRCCRCVETRDSPPLSTVWMLFYKHCKGQHKGLLQIQCSYGKKHVNIGLCIILTQLHGSDALTLTVLTYIQMPEPCWLNGHSYQLKLPVIITLFLPYSSLLLHLPQTNKQMQEVPPNEEMNTCKCLNNNTVYLNYSCHKHSSASLQSMSENIGMPPLKKYLCGTVL